jgi:hypothetical protein
VGSKGISTGLYIPIESSKRSAHPAKITRAETGNEEKGYNKKIVNEFKKGKKSWQSQHLII